MLAGQLPIRVWKHEAPPHPHRTCMQPRWGDRGLEQRKRHFPSFLLQTNQGLNSGKRLIVRLRAGNIHIKRCLSIAMNGSEGLGPSFHIMFCKHLGSTYCVAGYMLQRALQTSWGQREGSHPKPSWILQSLELPRAGPTGGGLRCLGQHPTHLAAPLLLHPSERPSTNLCMFFPALH